MKRCLNCMEEKPEGQNICPYCGYDEETTEERFDQLKPGSLLNNRFTVGRPLGRGGFGITYIAWDNSLQRKVAIKEYLPKGMATRESGNTSISYDSETKEAFLHGIEKTLEESRKLAGFSSLESVVNVYDCFKENGTAYIVMEVLKGENAKEKIRREGRLSFEETIGIITPVLKTLASVHKAGIIHRDISPDNIFICDNGKVKLLDFGSARVADGDTEKSRSIVLKQGYAPKEQYSTKGRQGPYTDIYAVCATLYKMLTGMTPVDSLERFAGEDELQNIAEIVKIPEPAARAIMKGMEINAADRIQSADELLAELTKTPLDGEETRTLYVPPVKSEPGPEPEPAPDPEPKPAKNQKTGKAANKKPIIGIVAAVLAVAAGIILIPKAVKNTNAKKETAETTSPTSEAESISETVAEILTEITTQITKKETTTAKETTAKETTTKLDLSKLPSAYITTKEADSGVYLRKSANEDAKTPELLKRGTEVKIIDKQGDWYKVAVNGKTGYIKSEYISYNKVFPFGIGYVKGGVYYNEWANIKCNFMDGGNTTGQYDCGDEIGPIMFSTQNSSNDLRIFIGYKKCNVNDAVLSGYDTGPYNGVIAGRQCVFYDGRAGLFSSDFLRDCYVQVDDYTVIFRLVSSDKESLDDLQNMIQKLN